jgi:hypothetical protein
MPIFWDDDRRMLKRLRDTLVAALFGAFVLMFGIAVWSASSCKPNDEKHNRAASTDAVPISCKSFNIVAIQTISVRLGRRPDVIAALVTAFATGVIAWFTVTLSSIGKQQATDARIIERAYINVVAPDSEIRMNDQHEIAALRVWVVWKNAGRTPAFPMYARIGATFVQRIEDFRFGEPAATVIDPMALGPTAEFTSGHIDIHPVHVLAAENGAGHQFLWGECRYRDTFPGSPVHVLEFCYRINIEGVPAPPLPVVDGIPRVRFNLHGDHNRYYDEPA